MLIDSQGGNYSSTFTLDLDTSYLYLIGQDLI